MLYILNMYTYLFGLKPAQAPMKVGSDNNKIMAMSMDAGPICLMTKKVWLFNWRCLDNQSKSDSLEVVSVRVLHYFGSLRKLKTPLTRKGSLKFVFSKGSHL